MAPIKDCTTKTIARFIFENIISQFRWPRSLTRDQGMHFLNETIESLLKTFIVQHNKSAPPTIQRCSRRI